LATVLQIGNQDRRSMLGGGRIDSDRVFLRARRHSRRVRFLRVGLPLAVIVGGVAAVVVTTVLDPLRALAKLPVDISGVVISGTKITMQAPRMVGFTRDKRPYAVTALAAAQDLTNPDMLELQQIRATMEMQDKSSVEVVARSGLYDTKGERLTLHQNILVTTPTYQGRLSEAIYDVHKGYILSEKPVEVQMMQGTINANRLEVENSGELIRFDRGVTMVLTPESRDVTGKVSAR
jgi:lipopolysaccharide export system protein LptC